MKKFIGDPNNVLKTLQQTIGKARTGFRLDAYNNSLTWDPRFAPHEEIAFALKLAKTILQQPLLFHGTDKDQNSESAYLGKAYDLENFPGFKKLLISTTTFFNDPAYNTLDVSFQPDVPF